MSDLSKKKDLLESHIQQGKKETAIKLIFELIELHVKNKEFDEAEILRDRMYDVDPMALDEIIRSGELIEEAKSDSIDETHKSIWSKLYSTLTTEEANALYFGMKESTFDANAMVFKQGDTNSNLYFINQGKLKQVYSQEGREVLLKTLGPGHLAGNDTFFSDAVCTTSLVTLSKSKLSYLEKDILKKWGEDFPGLEPFLYGYSLQFEKVQDLLRKKALDRRNQIRVKISGKAVILILSTSGSPVGKVFKGLLSDISIGGLSFFLKITKKETAHLLLGRRLNIKCAFQIGDNQMKIEQNGTVVGVRLQTFSDYSIHVRFDGLLPEKVVQRVKGLTSSIS
ncbi:MAG: cyclic nucleotide-binding domain-containing protein [Deltaproteobacteria bacterium]|nr:cyclic nucleotide-binding domain-containing protein [Deltaproteobacteria bacterium]